MSRYSSYQGRGGITSGAAFLSGISSAGTICTTQIRDARENEKREIGLLNDQLADYIEKVRFLEAQNRVLSGDIDLLRGFVSGGYVSQLFDTEIAQAKHNVNQTVARSSTFDREIASLTAQLDDLRKKWNDAVTAVKAHREDHDVDLDRLAKIEAEISLFKRKIRIVEDDFQRIKKENNDIMDEIARIRRLTQNELALKNERGSYIEDLLHQIANLQNENALKIEQELVFIRRDTTADNRDYFRHELQAAIREIRSDYENICAKNRNDIEVWYRQTVQKIREESPRVDNLQYRDELLAIRSTLSSVKTKFAELEARNMLLERTIFDLAQQQAEESKIYEISLSEKDAAISKLREQCTEITIQMEKLCDQQLSLHAEIERYRALLNGARVSNESVSRYEVGGDGGAGYSGATRITSTTTRTTSSSNINYSNIPTSRIAVGGTIGGTGVTGYSHNVSVGGNVGGYSSGVSVGGNVGGYSTGASVGGNIGGYQSGMSVGGNIGGGGGYVAGGNITSRSSLSSSTPTIGGGVYRATYSSNH